MDIDGRAAAAALAETGQEGLWSDASFGHSRGISEAQAVIRSPRAIRQRVSTNLLWPCFSTSFFGGKRPAVELRYCLCIKLRTTFMATRAPPSNRPRNPQPARSQNQPAAPAPTPTPPSPPAPPSPPPATPSLWARFWKAALEKPNRETIIAAAAAIFSAWSAFSAYQANHMKDDALSLAAAPTEQVGA
jgi:hypothetical protein